MTFKIFEGFTNINYGLSLKTDGPMELAAVNPNSRPSRAKFLKSVGINPAQTVSADLAHSNNTRELESSDAGKTIPKCDGLITREKNIFLTITVADCFPVYFFDSRQNIIALAHCGWRGAVAGLSLEIIRRIKSNPAHLLIGIGPGIGSCHFEIKEDILFNFKDYPEAISYRDNKIFVALVKIIRSQLHQAGVPLENIESVGECTACHPEKYFSFRRDKPKQVQPMLAYFGLV